MAITMSAGIGYRRLGPPDELDRATLERCRAKDPAAFRELVRRYERPVFVLLSRLVGPGSQVEDLAQEVFWRAFRGLSRFDVGGRATFSTWILTIATRVALDARKRRRLDAIPLEETTHAVAAGGPETERRRDEVGRAIARAMRELPSEQRDAFVLVELHGMSLEEAGRAVGIGAATVKTRLFRARERLKLLLSDLLEE
jgi:RNA polymerase sigma-70 factor (ECF subfamily)